MHCQTTLLPLPVTFGFDILMVAFCTTTNRPSDLSLVAALQMLMPSGLVLTIRLLDSEASWIVAESCKQRSLRFPQVFQHRFALFRKPPQAAAALKA